MPDLVSTLRASAPLSNRVVYTVWLCNPQGYRVQLISNYVRLHYTLGLRGGGGFQLELPPSFPRTFVKHLGFVEIRRSVGGGVSALQDVYVIQSQPEAQARRGARFLTLEGPSITDFLLGKNSRVVASILGGTGASYTDRADDAAKSYVWDAMGTNAGSSGTAAGRDLTGIYGFRMEAKRGLGPSVTEDGYTKPLDQVLAEIARKSEQDTTSPKRLFYWIRPYASNPLRFEFVTAVTGLTRSRGRYLGFTSGNPVILSPDWGTLGEVDAEYDRREEWTSLYVTYNTKASATRVTDTVRRNAAPGNFREIYYDATNSALVAAAQLEAQARLGEGKPRLISRAKVIPSYAYRYGAEYGMGDVVGTVVFGRRIEMEISGVEADVVDDETLSLKLEQLGTV